MYNILICDDEPDIRSALKIYLSSEGYGIFEAENGSQALDIIAKEEISLLLMDVMMPVMDGITALSTLRKTSNIPVILLTAKSQDFDKVSGLNAGADDYITKPFVPVEVIARVRSQLRRYKRLGGATEPEERDSKLCNGGIEYDDKSKTVTVDGEPVRLTATEYKIVRYLIENLGRTLSSNQIYENVWNENAFSSEKTVTVHIRRIREKIEIDSKNPKYIKVVWGIGYKIEKIQ